jgi:hypothetical protein
MHMATGMMTVLLPPKLIRIKDTTNIRENTETEFGRVSVNLPLPDLLRDTDRRPLQLLPLPLVEWSGRS